LGFRLASELSRSDLAKLRIVAIADDDPPPKLMRLFVAPA
jgi:hypothetical protein